MRKSVDSLTSDGRKLERQVMMTKANNITLTGRQPSSLDTKPLILKPWETTTSLDLRLKVLKLILQNNQWLIGV